MKVSATVTLDVDGVPAERRSAPRHSSLVFPEESMVGSLGELARTLAEGTEVPLEFLFAVSLTMMGGYAGTDLALDIGFPVEPRLYTVLLGDSYSVKKSTAMKKGVEFFEGLNIEQRPRIVYGVGSAEGLARELTQHPKLTICYDEFRALIDKCHVKGSALLPMVTSLYEATCWHNVVKDQYNSTYVDDAHLSLLACCTLDTFADIWKRDAIAIGLPNRLFLANADRRQKVAWPAKPNPERLSELRDQITKQLLTLPRTFGIRDEAKTVWAGWYKALPNSEHCRRLDTIGFRLLAIFALMTDKEVVDIEVVQKVCSILDYQLALRQITDPIDADNTIAGLEEKIRRHLAQQPLLQRELRRKTNADRAGIWAFNTALKNLLSSGEISLAKGVYCAVDLDADREAAA